MYNLLFIIEIQMSTYAELEAKVKQKQKRNELWKQLLQKVRDLRRKIKEEKNKQLENPDVLLENI